jgi:hypothetical protein
MSGGRHSGWSMTGSCRSGRRRVVPFLADTGHGSFAGAEACVRCRARRRLGTTPRGTGGIRPGRQTAGFGSTRGGSFQTLAPVILLFDSSVVLTGAFQHGRSTGMRGTVRIGRSAVQRSVRTVAVPGTSGVMRFRSVQGTLDCGTHSGWVHTAKNWCGGKEPQRQRQAYPVERSSVPTANKTTCLRNTLCVYRYFGSTGAAELPRFPGRVHTIRCRTRKRNNNNNNSTRAPMGQRGRRHGTT